VPCNEKLTTRVLSPWIAFSRRSPVSLIILPDSSNNLFYGTQPIRWKVAKSHRKREHKHRIELAQSHFRVVSTHARTNTQQQKVVCACATRRDETRTAFLISHSSPPSATVRSCF